jgi:hypothetical protein
MKKNYNGRTAIWMRLGRGLQEAGVLIMLTAYTVVAPELRNVTSNEGGGGQ